MEEEKRRGTSYDKRKEKDMKEQILEILKNIHEARTLIEINDLLGLTTVDELKELYRNGEIHSSAELIAILSYFSKI